MPRLALLFPLFLAGCASLRGPISTPLDATATALDLAGVAITAESRAADAATEADYRARVAACPALPLEREACKATAREQTLTAMRPRNARLTEAAKLQNDAATLTEAALACRRGKQTCEADKAKAALAALDELKTLLAAMQKGTP